MDILVVRLASVAASFRLVLDTSGKKTLDRDNDPFCKEPANIRVPLPTHSFTPSKGIKQTSSCQTNGDGRAETGGRDPHTLEYNKKTEK